MKPVFHFKSNSTYRFKRRLGSGGTAEALLYSRDIAGLPSQDVVLKVIKDSKKDGLDELINDGKRLSQLRHPHIVATFGFEKINEKEFGLLLEYVPGCDLKKLIPVIHKSTCQGLVVFIISRMLEALSFAHEQGIVHGDVSARNILVSKKGQLKLSDFGLAVKTHAAQNGRKTKGSIDYWSPKRWQNGEATLSSDLFALGIIAYEILSGENPLRNDDVAGVKENLDTFLKNRKWNDFLSWKPFFDALFCDSEQHLMARELIALVPHDNNPQVELQKVLASCFRGTSLLETSSRTVTVMVEKLFTRKKYRTRVFAASVLFMLIGLLPFATGTDHTVAGRFRPYSLTVTSDPWGEVFIDGKSVGYTPLLNHTLKSGGHRFTWRDSRGRVVQKTITAYENGSVFFRVR
ncbi:MAG: serine/threonine-protein kinase [Oligoflexia bacterium]|nr:serine/threonine-protein kinase [Oligoflexia bacterium]